MSGMDRLDDAALESIVHGNSICTMAHVQRMARELLAHRRASQAAPAPSDGLREAVAAAWNDAIEAAGNLESIHGYSNAVPRHRIRALRRAAPTEGEAQSLDDTTRAVLDRAERIVAGQSQQEQRTAEIFLRPTEGEA